MKHTATVTWIKYPNFGTYLQAYALQQVVLKLGHTNVILDDSPIVEEGKKLSSQLSLYRKLRRKIGFVIHKIRNRTHTRLYRESLDCYSSFRIRHLRTASLSNDLTELDEKYDSFICGSDQIWSPSLNIFSPYYYLSFTKKKKIAYAPSVGKSVYPKEFIPKVKPLLESFDFLSVRETKGAELLENFLDRTVNVVLDPTLLLTGEDWKSLTLSEHPLLKKDEYIFCYLLTYNQTYVNYINKYARSKGLPVYSLTIQGVAKPIGDKQLVGGPIEFLTAIRNAAYVFTDSFHATIFSLHFEKVFGVLKRFKDGAENNQNSRVENLLKLVGYEEVFVGEEQLQYFDELKQIDYNQVWDKLAIERERSLSYLNNALSN